MNETSSDHLILCNCEGCIMCNCPRVIPNIHEIFQRDACRRGLDSAPAAESGSSGPCTLEMTSQRCRTETLVHSPQLNESPSTTLRTRESRSPPFLLSLPFSPRRIEGYLPCDVGRGETPDRTTALHPTSRASGAPCSCGGKKKMVREGGFHPFKGRVSRHFGDSVRIPLC
jgi:hypothetical protein